MKHYALTGALLLLLASAGCRGMETDNPPIHLNPNMDEQERYDPQEANAMFENGMAMRQPVPGTVARGFLREDTRFFTGKTEQGHYVEKVPVTVTQALLERGRARFNIYCTPCHGQAGNGKGIIMTGDYGYAPAPTYHKATLRDTADGYLFNVITNGVRNMPSYAQQVPVADRWAIVTYIRALQRSQNARRENVPPSVLARIEQTGNANMNAARNGTGSPGAASGGASSSSSGSSSSGSSSGSSSSGSSSSGSNTSAGNNASGGESQSNASNGSSPPPADTAAPGPAAAASSSGAPGAAPDTAGAGAATAAAADSSAGGSAAGMDTTSERTAVAEGANVTEDTSGAAGESGGTTTAGGAEEGGGFFGSTFAILLLVMLPILCLMVLLVVAFRRN